MRELVYHQGTSRDHLDRFEPEWRQLWHSRPRQPSKVALLTTCSHAKPYSKSYVHATIRHALYRAGLLRYVDIVHVSSAGIIPTDADLRYPFCAYDWNDEEATAEEREAYVQRVPSRFDWWLQHVAYRGFCAYFNPDDDNLRALPLTPSLVRVPVRYSHDLPWVQHQDVDDCLTDPENLRALTETLSMLTPA